MQPASFGKAVSLSVLFGLSGIGGQILRAETGLTADAVIQKAVARAQLVERGVQPCFDYSKVTVTEELDASGKVKERTERVYKVTLRAGQSHVRILAVNGRAPDAAELKKQNENQMNFRQALGQSKASKGDNRDNFLTSELAARFQFRLVTQKPVNGRAAYEVAFQPKSPAPPERRMVDRLLNRLSGTLWIDAEEFEVARAEVFLGSEVNVLGGVIGSLKRLAYTLNRSRLDDGVWLSTSSTGDFEARKLLDSTHIKTKSSSKNFRRVVRTG